MQPGGTNEIIAHFAGYLRVIEDPYRSGEIYDGDLQQPTKPWSGLFKPTGAALLPDEIESQPVRPEAALDTPTLKFGGMKLPKGKPIVPPHDSHPKLDAVEPPPLAPAHSSGGGGGHSSVVYETSTAAEPFDPTPHQVLAEIVQLNALNDDDYLVMTDDPRVLALHHTNSAELLGGMLKSASEATPDDLRPAGLGSEDLIHTVLARDSATASGQKHSGGDVSDGVYVDGRALPDGTTFSIKVPEAPSLVPEYRNGANDLGLKAVTGENTSINLATIIDEHPRSGMIVMGDAFTTKAIIQTNVFTSLADIEVGGDPTLREVLIKGNEAHNTASFNQHEPLSGLKYHGYTEGNAKIDVISGNFYDVHRVDQINTLSDNDVVVQGTFSTYYTAIAGANQQISEMSFKDVADQYDLIVIKGDYHSSNVISQSNVLLTDSAIKSFSGRNDTSVQSINAGDNTLANQASIDLYGESTFRHASSGLLDQASHLPHGTVGSLLTDGLPNFGSGPLHVLYVTGNYFDINYISQTNVVTNIDTAIQYLPNPGMAMSAWGNPTTSDQSIVSGGNTLFNGAQIASIGTGSGFQFLGGQHYDDAILVQSNIISERGNVTVGSPQTLVPELVAFTGLENAHAEPSHMAAGGAIRDPTTGHDLFHGMMA